METIVWIVVSVIFVLMLKLSGKSRKAKLIDQLPGPPGVPLFGNAFQFIGVDRADRVNKIVERDRKYGPIYRNWIVNIPYVHIASAELAQTVLNLTNTNKGQIYTFLREWFGYGLLTVPDGEMWTRSRRLITPTFHFQNLDSYVDVFKESSVTLINKLKKHANTDTPVDMAPLLTLASLDVICEAAMGIKINAQGNKESAYVKAVYEIQQLIYHRYDRFWLHSDWAWRRSAAGKKAKKIFEILHGFTENVIKERKLARQEAKLENSVSDFDGSGGKRKRMFIDLLLDECDSQEAGFTDVQLRDEINTFMFEGHDTTTAALTYTILRLANNQDIQEEVYNEQVGLFGTSTTEGPTMQDLKNMTLLDRVFKEALRLHPSVPFISRTLREDTKLGDYLIPAGSVIFISLVSIQRDPRVFSDPDKFDPDRFLLNNSTGRNPYANIPFSAGPRNCIGQRFATLEAKTLLSYIIRNFHIKPHTTVEDCKTIVELVQKPICGLMVKLFSRNTK